MHNGLHSLTTRLGAAALAAAVAFQVQAQSSRLSLAERVARLEQQQAQGQGNDRNVEFLNRISELQSEVQSLRGLVEQQSFEIESLKKQNRDQYLDLDGRLSRLAGGTPAGVASPIEAETPGVVHAPDEPGFSTVEAPSVTSPHALPMEEPDVRPPIEDDSSSTAVDSAAPTPVEALADPADERRMYESAFDALKEGRYAEAARRFQGFLNSYPNGEFAPNAHYWLGESYYVTQNYQIALDAFSRLLSQFPASTKSPDALLKVGYCQYELRQWAEAEATLNQVVAQFPDSTVARLAQGRLRALRLENRE